MLQGIAAAAAAPTAEYGEVCEVLLPLVQQVSRDEEAEIRSTAIKQLAGLGESWGSVVVAVAGPGWLAGWLRVAVVRRRQNLRLRWPSRHHSSYICLTAQLLLSQQTGTALYGKDAERSMRDIEATLLVCAQQCALDDEDEVRVADRQFVVVWL